MADQQGSLGHSERGVPGEQSDDAVPFETVLAAELEDIGESRRLRCEPPLAEGDDALEVARASRLTGLALSGGGIRSATFCLGVIQALAAAGILKRFDYLSTVSGGGYIGGWLAAWIQRTRRGVLRVQRSLRQSVQGIKTSPLDFIRDYSNYLAPNVGLFSTDTWTIGSVWLRNTVLNQSVILMFFAACLLIPRLLALLLPWISRFPLPEWVPYRNYAPVLPGLAGAILMLFVVRRMGANLLWFENPRDPKARRDAQPEMVVSGCLLLAASWLGSAGLWQARKHPVTPWVVGAIFLIGVILLGRQSGFVTCFRRIVGREKGNRWPLALAMTGLGSAGSAIALTVGLAHVFDRLAAQGASAVWHLAVWGGPLVLALMTIIAVVQIGLMGRWLPDDRREWWSRLGAWMFILITACIALSCISIYGPLWVAEIFCTFPNLSKGITAGWVVTTLGGVMAGNSGKSGSAPGSRERPNRALELVTRCTPYIAIPGILLAVSTLLNLILAAALCNGIPAKAYPPQATVRTAGKLNLEGSLDPGKLKVEVAVPVEGVVTEIPAPAPAVQPRIASVCVYHEGFFPGWRFLRDQHWNLLGPMYYTPSPPVWGTDTGYWKVAWAAWITVAVATLFLAWRIDVNEFSLHHFYKNRLVRCYLGASNPHRERKVNRFTGFSTSDDVRLAALRPGHATRPYVGPYPIVNGALNFTHGERLAWQERKAASFVFTPRYCGFDGTLLGAVPKGELAANAYRRSDKYAYPERNGGGGIHIGTAMAISGAAASPTMGYHTSTPVAFLLTLFNVRLGWWLGNPRHARKWKRNGPAIGLLYLLNELFGSATTSSAYVYISDGGHYENLGLYELVRRRCRLIVACDSEEDANFTFGGLGNAIRKCRSDLGIDIVIDLRPLMDRDEYRRTSTHLLVGSIDYHDGHESGVLIYLKSSLTKPEVHSEPADVLEYSMRAREFPHQSTGDQFFDESQFESYRKLGLHIGEAAVETIRQNSLTNPSHGAHIHG